MIKRRKLIASLVVGILCVNTFGNYSMAWRNPIEEAKKKAEVVKEIDFKALTVEEAIETGIKNSIDLRLVKNNIALAKVRDKRASDIGESLIDGDDLIKSNKNYLSESQSAVDAGKAQLEQQQAQYDAIKGGLTEEQQAAMEAQLAAGAAEIEANQTAIDAGYQKLDGANTTLINALQDTGEFISGAIDFSSLNSYGVDGSANLAATMAEISYEVTNASYEIYKNAISLGIEKNYYDALKAEKIVGVKAKAEERGKVQYQFSKDGYDEGLNAKDEVLVANLFYEGTQIEHKIAETEYKNALITLKKSLNIPLDTEIGLIDIVINEKEVPNLEEGIKSGIENRLEAKSAIGELAINQLNFELASKKYTSNTYPYQEAKLLEEQAQIKYENVELGIKSSIRESYQTLISVGEMIDMSKQMVKEAEENLEIAEFKYKEGYGTETTLLRSLDIEGSAGTLVDVLAAEETYTDVEEQIIELTHNYNLAKMKYYNDIAKFND